MNDYFEINPKLRINVKTLKKLLPCIEATLFFAKVYELDMQRLGQLLMLVHRTALTEALLTGSHSLELQDYIVEVAPPDIVPEISFGVPSTPVDSELLTQLWKDAELEVAASIKEVADKLAGTLHMLPSKEGRMMFQSIRVVNAKRPTIGDYRATIKHQQVPDVAVVLDVSGSMSEHTVRTIIDDVVALSWNANAHLFIVSNNTYHWEPGTYDSSMVLDKAEFSGTQYETLAPAFCKDWGTVITIADYDSSASAKRWIKSNCTGRIGQVLDISLVERQTFLSECLGQLAGKVKPLLVAQFDLTRTNRSW